MHALRVGDSFEDQGAVCKIKEQVERVCDVEFVFFFLLKGNTTNDNKHPSYREGATQNLIPKDVQPFKISTATKMACGHFHDSFSGRPSLYAPKLCIACLVFRGSMLIGGWI